jgi:hypothetical protein
MVTKTLKQIIDDRISFLKEQANNANTPKVSSMFQVQIDAIRSVDDIEKVESVRAQERTIKE